MQGATPREEVLDYIPRREDEGYFLSMGDMIAQHQKSQIDDAYNEENSTNIIVPNRFTSMSGEYKKSVSPGQGGSIRGSRTNLHPVS